MVEHLGGDGGEATQTGTTLAGSQGISTELTDGPAVAFAVLLGNGDLGCNDGRLQFLELRLV